MKAILQNFRTGDMSVSDVPPPLLKDDGVLVRTAASLVSAGTEKAVIELARMNPIQKARARPDLVKKVLDKAGQEGLFATARIVSNLVSAPLPLGYSVAGTVIAVGRNVADLRPSQQVACAGLGYANHAEVCYVPRHLTVPIPDGVSFQDAAFVTVGAIALHGVRQAHLTLGESVAIIGMGLVGQIVAQICRASGCRVFCIDIDHFRVDLARQLGAEAGLAGASAEIRAAVLAFTAGRGADAVLIAAGTKSSAPIELAAEIARDRARVVAIGDVGHNVPRRAFYEKELELLQSRSYGPGRYDPAYEEKGSDYPIGYVRWTENRNMAAFLDLVAGGRVRLDPLVTHRFALEQATAAYDLLLGETAEPYIGILLGYDTERAQSTIVRLDDKPRPAPRSVREITLGVIGAGQFAQGVLLPVLKQVGGARIRAVATGSGLTSVNVGQKYGAEICTSDYQDILKDPAIDAVIIATRHDTHAEIVADSLNARKACYVEKPLALTEAGLAKIERIAAEKGGVLMTGFNRRYSPLAVRLRREMGDGPLVMNYRVNAGFVAGAQWQQDRETGGGRIIGEICHFIDLMQFLCDADPVAVTAVAAGGNQAPADPDDVALTLTFSDGSIGTITYTSSGFNRFPKERLEVFGGGSVGVIENWRSLLVRGDGKHVRIRCWLQAEKGHREEMAAFIRAVETGETPLPIATQLATTRATFAAQRALRTGGSEPVVMEQLA